MRQVRSEGPTCLTKKDNEMKPSLPFTVLIVSVAILFLSACAPQAKKTDPALLGETVLEATEAPTLEFTLKTAHIDGKLAYIGVRGEIDGITNPDLVVQPGDTVRVILINGDGAPHDLFFPDFNVKTSYVAKIDQQTETVFEVGDMQAGAYAYYCTVPGHRKAGQEGKLIVRGSSE